MSVALTEDAVVERRKTVTRRVGWRFLKPGDTLTLCRKVQGRKPGDPLVRLAEVEVVSVRREGLGRILQYGRLETAREGFPHMWPSDFIDFFTREMRCTPDTQITRIEWRYLEGGSS